MADISASSLIPKVSMAGVLNWVFIGLMIVLAIFGVWFVWWYTNKKKKYGQYRIEILDKDSNGNVYKTYDNAGVFLNKQTDMRLLWIEKAKIGMNPNNIPYISTISKKGKIIKTVTLRKIGVNNYVYVTMVLGEKVLMTMGEEDINNSASEMRKVRQLTNKENWMTKLAPYILFILTILAVMIVLISLFNKFEVLKQVSANMETITEKQFEITDLLRNMTVINQQAPIITGGVIR